VVNSVLGALAVVVADLGESALHFEGFERAVFPSALRFPPALGRGERPERLLIRLRRRNASRGTIHSTEGPSRAIG